MAEGSKHTHKSNSISMDKLKQIIEASSIKNSALEKILKGISDQHEMDEKPPLTTNQTAGKTAQRNKKQH